MRVLDVPPGPRELRFGGVEFPRKPGLLDLQYVERDRFRIGEVALNEPLPLADDFVNVLLATDDLPLAVADQPLELLDEPRFKLGDPIPVDLDRVFVVAGDEMLDAVRGHIRERALLPFVAIAADEVVELVAVATGAFGEAQPPPAKAAEHRALQVMAVFWRPIAGQPVGGEYLLDALEQLLGDEAGMIAVVLDTLKIDLPDVVAIPEKVVHDGLADLAGSALRRRLGTKAAPV